MNASPSALAPVVPRPRFATVDLRSDLHCHCVAVGRDRTCIRGLLTALGVKAPCSSPSQFEPSVMHVRLQRLSRPLLHDSGGAGGVWLHTSPLNPSTTFTAFTMLSQVVGLTTCDVGRSLAPLAASATALLAVPGRLRTIVRVQGLRRCVSTVLSTASLAASTQACAPPLQAHLLQQRDASARAGAAHLWQASWRVLPRGCPPPFRLRRLRRRRLLGLLDAPTPCGRACSTRRDRLQLRQLGRSGLLCCVGCWWGLAIACAESALRCAGGRASGGVSALPGPGAGPAGRPSPERTRALALGVPAPRACVFFV